MCTELPTDGCAQHLLKKLAEGNVLIKISV